MLFKIVIIMIFYAINNSNVLGKEVTILLSVHLDETSQQDIKCGRLNNVLQAESLKLNMKTPIALSQFKVQSHLYAENILFLLYSVTIQNIGKGNRNILHFAKLLSNTSFKGIQFSTNKRPAKVEETDKQYIPIEFTLHFPQERTARLLDLNAVNKFQQTLDSLKTMGNGLEVSSAQTLLQNSTLYMSNKLKMNLKVEPSFLSYPENWPIVMLPCVKGIFRDDVIYEFPFYENSEPIPDTTVLFVTASYNHNATQETGCVVMQNYFEQQLSTKHGNCFQMQNTLQNTTLHVRYLLRVRDKWEGLTNWNQILVHKALPTEMVALTVRIAEEHEHYEYYYDECPPNRHPTTVFLMKFEEKHPKNICEIIISIPNVSIFIPMCSKHRYNVYKIKFQYFDAKWHSPNFLMEILRREKIPNLITVFWPTTRKPNVLPTANK